MVKVEIVGKDIINLYGHTMYEDFGKDIVCASLSCIVITSVNAINTFDNKAVDVEQKKDLVTIKVLKHDKITNNLIKNMLTLIEELANKYQDNIKIIVRR